MSFTELYVDPSINADSGTGTVGDPYGDLEYCIEEEDWDATNGIRVNIKAGSTETLAAELSAAMADVTSANKSIAWAPSNGAPLVFQGYTSAAADGGVGNISGGGSVAVIDAASQDYTHFVDLKLENTGANRIVYLDNTCSLVRCELTNCSHSYAAQVGDTGVFHQCYVHNVVGGIFTQGAVVRQCWIEAAAGTALATNGGGNFWEHNIIKVTNVAGRGMDVSSGNSWVNQNSIYCTVAGTDAGIVVDGVGSSYILNNLIEGFSGTGGVGIDVTDTDMILMGYGGNGVYDCAMAYDEYSGIRKGKDWGDNETLVASPFSNAASDDFAPVNTGNVVEGALPSGFYTG